MVPGFGALGVTICPYPGDVAPPVRRMVYRVPILYLGCKINPINLKRFYPLYPIFKECFVRMDNWGGVFGVSIWIKWFLFLHLYGVVGVCK